MNEQLCEIVEKYMICPKDRSKKCRFVVNVRGKSVLSVVTKCFTAK